MVLTEFVSSDLKQWCESLGNKKMESPIYQPRANGNAEREVQTVKRAIQAWSPNLNVSFNFPTAGFIDTSEHFQDAGQNSCRTDTETQS